jgi:hypothetical protein
MNDLNFGMLEYKGTLSKAAHRTNGAVILFLILKRAQTSGAENIVKAAREAKATDDFDAALRDISLTLQLQSKNGVPRCEHVV